MGAPLKAGEPVTIQVPCAGLSVGDSVKIKVFEPHGMGGDPIDTIDAKVATEGMATGTWTFDASKEKPGLRRSVFVFVAEGAGRVTVSSPVSFVDSFEAAIADSQGNKAANRVVKLHASRGEDVTSQTDDGGNVKVALPPGDYHLELLGPTGAPAVAPAKTDDAAPPPADPTVPDPITPSVVATLEGIHFEFDKTFPLPSVIDLVTKIAKFANKEPSREIVSVGHTDWKGDAGYNLKLSEDRAGNIAAYLRDDVEAWLPFYSPRSVGKAWGTREDQHMLSTIPHGGTPFLDKGQVSDTNTQAAKDAMAAFQRDQGLPDDGKATLETRRALIRVYMSAPDSSIPSGKPIDVLGCGKFHPPQPPTQDDAKWRRVEIFLFRGDPAPPADACRHGVHPGCHVYEDWLKKAKEIPDSPPSPPHDARWEDPGADDTAPPKKEAAVGDQVELAVLYGPRPDDVDPPVFTVFDATDVARKKPLVQLTATENADKTRATATWTVTAPWRAGSDSGTKPKASGPAPLPSSLPTGTKNSVVLDVRSIRRVTAFAADDKPPPPAAAGSEPDVLPVVAQAKQPLELVGELDGFVNPPGKGQFEVYAKRPGGTGPPARVVFVAKVGPDEALSPVLSVTGAGTPPLLVITADLAPDQETATFTYDPDDPAQKPLGSEAWIVAVADDATRTGVLALGHATLSNPRWLWKKGKPLRVLRTGQAVTLACDAKGASPDLKPVFELYDAASALTAKAKPFDTVPAQFAKGVLSATWNAAAPPAAQPGGAVPEVVFILRVGGDQVVSSPRAVLPVIRITLEAGDPNAFYEPIVAPPVTAQATGKGEHQDHARDANRDPDAPAGATRFEKRVLGVKQRLQALGYY
ncbi:MAG TPA: peptidoglycan-binding protein, partial [Planctomycetota bacterium]|nr:peptidoglycan-binding protein [Planctomycetota bacterium]